jgi:hypothetical protein
MDKLQIDGDALSNGPVMNRSCTDPICCLIFVAFITGMAATAAYGFNKGNPKLLVTGWDADRKTHLFIKTYRQWLRLQRKDHGLPLSLLACT